MNIAYAGHFALTGIESIAAIALCSLVAVGCQSSSPDNGDTASDSGYNTEGIDSESIVPEGRLSVRDGKLVDETERQVTLKGLGLGALSEVKASGQWNETYFENARLWGADLVRLPVSPGSYREDPEQVLGDIDDALGWCEKHRLYLIVDYHVIGNAEQGLFLYEESGSTTWQEINDFWATVAERYNDNPALAFAEIYNEPSEVDFMGGSWSFDEWKREADKIIATLRTHGPNIIPLVAGLDYAYDLTEVENNPFSDKDIALSVHIYPGKVRSDRREEWDKAFGFLSDRYPFVITEFGFDPDDEIDPNMYRDDLTFGREILTYASERHISWTAFTFFMSPWWPAPLFYDWDTLTPTLSGLFIKEVLSGKSIAEAGEGFEPISPDFSNGPSGFFWLTWSDMAADVEWAATPTRERVGVHIEAEPGAQAGLYASLSPKGGFRDLSMYNEIAFKGDVAEGVRFSVSFGGNIGGVYHGCSYDLTGSGADTYIVDMLTPDECTPNACFDLQATGITFNNATSDTKTAVDIWIEEVVFSENPQRPLPTSGRIGTEDCGE